MATDSVSNGDGDSAGDLPSPDAGAVPILGGDEFAESFAEPLGKTLDLSTWHPGQDLIELYDRLRQEVAEAVRQEDRIHHEIRERIFPLLKTRDGAPPGAGVWKVEADKLAEIHNKLLFNGAVS